MTDVAATPRTGPRVFSAIAAVMSDLAKEGIAKTSKNQQQGYNFRGIDAIYNELSPVLARHNLLMLPRVLSREVTERVTQKGGALFYVVVEAEFDLICAEDASQFTIRTFGEAMDSADKATNKAMSAAYKYAAMQAFCIPTEGDNDADATTHAVMARKTLSSQHAKTIIKTDVIQAMIDGATTTKEADDAAARINEYAAFMPAAWIKAFTERLDHQRDLIAKGGVVDEPPAGAAMDQQFKDTIGPVGVDTKAMLTRSVAMEDMAAKLKAAKSPENLGAMWDAEVEGKFEGDARSYLIRVYEEALAAFGVAAN
jgi:hypothetical protein